MLVLKDPQSGSRANVTASHNRYGQYERNRRTPTQSPTTRRTDIKSLFASNSSGYSALTEAEQAAWRGYADSHPITNRLGQSITLDGHAMFVRINSNLVNSGGTALTLPPTTDDVPVIPELLAVVMSTTAFTVSTAGQDADVEFLVSAGPQRNQGRTFEGLWSQLGHTPGGGGAPVAFKTAYDARFGVPVIGKCAFVKLTPVNADGVRGTPVVLKKVIAA